MIREMDELGIHSLSNHRAIYFDMSVPMKIIFDV